jgi:hypothetical protein
MLNAAGNLVGTLSEENAKNGQRLSKSDLVKTLKTVDNIGDY